MTASRQQHAFAASIILAVAIAVAWISFTQEPAEAFLFPRLISIFFAGLAVWNFIRAASGVARVGVGLTAGVFWNMLPGFAVMLLFVFLAAKSLGFYVGSTIVFFVISAIYDAADPRNAGVLGKKVAVTLSFMAVIYGLFALLLKVQTPRGWFF